VPKSALARFAASASSLLLAVTFGTPLHAQAALKQPVSLNGAACTTATGYDKDRQYDTIVIGAGLAGLTAARELQHLNRSVLVLESNDRIGGRGFVGYVGPEQVPIDYGGAWIHGVSTNPLTSLVDAAGLHRARTNLNTRFYIGDHPADDEHVKAFDDALEEFEDGLQRASQSRQDQRALSEFACHELKDHGKSRKEVCDKLEAMLPNGKALAETPLCQLEPQSPEQFCERAEKVLVVTSDSAEKYMPKVSPFSDVLPLLVANAGPLESAQELDKTSAVEASAFEAGEDDLVDKGLGTFVQKTGEWLPVCLNSPVNAVRYGTAGVTVHAGGRTFSALTALVTVSVGVLQAKKIAFEPELPKEKLKAIASLKMGNMQKVIIPFSEDISPTEEINSWVLYEGKLPANALKFAADHKLPVIGGGRFVMAFVFKPLGKPIAIGFFGGDWAKALEANCQAKKDTSGLYVPGDCDGLAVEIARDALSTMFGKPKVDEAILDKQIHLTHWSLDNTSLGAYSVASPGEWTAHEELAQPVRDRCNGKRLFFAGEGTARAIYNGSYPGAYESGLKAAREISVELLERPMSGPGDCH
jgi:monoamine oxidase